MLRPHLTLVCSFMTLHSFAVIVACTYWKQPESLYQVTSLRVLKPH